jgi:D-beta-D-heptose 7-phosphate kinase/D-beta-D-heptose 1-phosphate adenosyltransferase
VVRFDHENREHPAGRTLRGLLDSIGKAVAGHDAVVVSDYKKGLVNSAVIKAVLRAARGGKFFAVDPKMGHFHIYKGVSLITPNLVETSHGAGIEITDEKSLKKAGAKLMRKLGLKAVLVTRGEQGMSLFREGTVVHIPTLARKVFDVTGAGDTVIAAFTLAHASGASMEEAAVISNHAAGIVVGEVGTACATQERLRQSIRASKIKVERESI